jgi:hypothetical protein
MKLSIEQLKKLPVFGIAGNFAEHLSQAGEDADFVNVITAEKNAPKGIFPIYLPDYPSFLGDFPLAYTELQADFSAEINLHMEPEICVLFDVKYQNSNIISLQALAFTAFNDCSIRKPNANKISEKKNWGESCAGIARQWQSIDQFQSGGILDNYHIVSYLQRGGEVMQYGIDSPVTGYQFFYGKLLKWIINTFNTQVDFGPLENLHHYLLALQQPSQVIISLGATRYTEFGETGFLRPDDQIGVFVYDSTKATAVDMQDFFTKQEAENSLRSGIALIQTVGQNAG